MGISPFGLVEHPASSPPCIGGPNGIASEILVVLTPRRHEVLWYLPLVSIALDSEHHPIIIVAPDGELVVALSENKAVCA